MICTCAAGASGLRAINIRRYYHDRIGLNGKCHDMAADLSGDSGVHEQLLTFKTCHKNVYSGLVTEDHVVGLVELQHHVSGASAKQS